MADQPVDCTDTHYVPALCLGCGTHVVTVPGVTEPLCLDCRRAKERIDWPWLTAEGEWHPTLGYSPPGWSGRLSEPGAAQFGPAEYEIGRNLTPFADVDPDREFSCLICRERWPSVVGLTPEQDMQSLRDHDRVAHSEGVWLVGGPGGADEGVCAPCGGGSRDKTPLPGGPDHAKCLKGTSSGWYGRCGCKHRSRADLDAIVGKNRPNWRPNRWSDPKIVEIAVENVQNRWNQMNLWEGPS